MNIPAKVHRLLPDDAARQAWADGLAKAHARGIAGPVASREAWDAVVAAGYTRTEAGRYVKDEAAEYLPPVAVAEAAEQAIRKRATATAAERSTVTSRDLRVARKLIQRAELTASDVRMMGEELAKGGPEDLHTLRGLAWGGPAAKAWADAILDALDAPAPAMIAKVDTDRRLAFGFASVTLTADGQPLEDLQGDTISPEELEKAAYRYMATSGEAGVMHAITTGIGKAVESMVITTEKADLLGIDPAHVGKWWLGVYVEDDQTWAMVKSGALRMFSIGGRAKRSPVG